MKFQVPHNLLKEHKRNKKDGKSLEEENPEELNVTNANATGYDQTTEKVIIDDIKI